MSNYSGVLIDVLADDYISLRVGCAAKTQCSGAARESVERMFRSVMTKNFGKILKNAQLPAKRASRTQKILLW